MVLLSVKALKRDSDREGETMTTGVPLRGGLF